MILQSIYEETKEASTPCEALLMLGRLVTHDPVTEDGEHYFCAQCGCTLNNVHLIH
ncbi:putative zinc-ribbon [Caudoviricetes sp.]|nr:putative zinc-ribbon [Caudoviricetes sp.]UOF79122.1 putative zinc-ribbon [Caudoviricetes sp.]